MEWRMPLGIAEALAQLEQRGWTLASVADELGEKWLAVYRWRDGTHVPDDPRVVLDKIEALARRTPNRPGDRRGRPAPER